MAKAGASERMRILLSASLVLITCVVLVLLPQLWRVLPAVAATLYGGAAASRLMYGPTEAMEQLSEAAYLLIFSAALAACVRYRSPHVRSATRSLLPARSLDVERRRTTAGRVDMPADRWDGQS